MLGKTSSVSDTHVLKQVFDLRLWLDLHAMRRIRFEPEFPGRGDLGVWRRRVRENEFAAAIGR